MRNQGDYDDSEKSLEIYLEKMLVVNEQNRFRAVQSSGSYMKTSMNNTIFFDPKLCGVYLLFHIFKAICILQLQLTVYR